MLAHGITHKLSPAANPNYVSIGDPSLISTRDNILLANGRHLGEYIPFYFGKRSPMLYVIQHGFNGLTPTPAAQIVYCVSSVQHMIDAQLTFAFTDGHAVDSLSTLYGPDQVTALDSLLDWSAIRAFDWKSQTDLDLKRRKQAEFLVLGDIPPSAITGFVVYDQRAKAQLIEMGAPEVRIHIDKNYYFVV